jgi:hypothetical protein
MRWPTELLVVDRQLSAVTLTCMVCANAFERLDVAGCPFHQGAICSLCCSLEKDCHDDCKKTDRRPWHARRGGCGASLKGTY